MNTKRLPIEKIVGALLVGAALKLHYSTTGVNGLLWILAPTRALVELATGTEFAFEAHSGYMSRDHTFLIAPSCAGVNFLIAAFLMLSFQKLRRFKSETTGWSFLPFSIVAAYLTTVLANSVRISAALQIRHLDPQSIWLNPDQLHRFEGIVVYFGFLVLLYIAGERSSSDALRGARRWLIPVVVYYATTIAVPLVTGAYRRDSAEFIEHCLFVLATPALIIVPVMIVSFFRERRLSMRIGRLNPN